MLIRQSLFLEVVDRALSSLHGGPITLISSQTFGLAIIAAVTGLLKGVGGLLEQLEDKDSVSPVMFPA